tara:strand:- start:1190 stop:1474 length:285 start_codon:yes stop_codon:yes gene_type:complete
MVRAHVLGVITTIAVLMFILVKQQWKNDNARARKITSDVSNIVSTFGTGQLINCVLDTLSLGNWQSRLIGRLTNMLLQPLTSHVADVVTNTLWD